ncbi:MAG TPA: TerB family tellurite resistance protein [Labilithrix sp.]|nr:TerB family tellurite resistance protein [Labilithrix sp.]
MIEIVAAAIDQLCVAFERGGYNPTPIIDLGVLVVIADGVVDDKERAVLRDVFQTLLETKLTPEVVDHLVTASVQVVEAAGAESRARLIAEILRDCDAVEPGILVALAVAYASDGFSKEERVVIERIADFAEVPRGRLEELIARVRARADGDPMSIRTLLSTGAHRPVRVGKS